MKRILSVLCLFTLAACTSSPPTPEKEADAAAAATDQCLANPDLAKNWGECNVKTTIFNRADAIGKCQVLHSKTGANGTLMLKIRLRPNGKVQNVRADTGSARNPNLEKCLSKEIAQLQFAVPPKGVQPVIYFPFQQN